MSLAKSDLKNDIQSMLGEDADSEKDFAEGLMKAYKSYAEEAEDTSKDKILKPLSVNNASKTLKPVLEAVNMAGITEASAVSLLSEALGVALLTVWPGVKFAVTAPGIVGTVAFTASETLSTVSFPGDSSKAAIAGLPPTENLSEAASVWADAMDNFTKTVEVTITGMILVPGGSPVPGLPITAPIT